MVPLYALIIKWYRIIQKIIQEFPKKKKMPSLQIGYHKQETRYQYIIYQGEDDYSEWSQRCLRQADRVIFIAHGHHPPLLSEVEKVIFSETQPLKINSDLLLLHNEDVIFPKDTNAWLQLRPGVQSHHIKKGSIADLQRLVRIVSGNCISLVLEGNATLGLSYLGAYKALDELGIPIDWVGGTSLAVTVGAFIAMNYTPEKAIEVSKQILSKRRQFTDYTLPILSLISGHSLAKILRQPI